MLIGYARVSKSDGSQVTDLQIDALKKAGVEQIYEDRCSGKLESRPELDACLKAARSGDSIVVWRLDRIGRDIKHLLTLTENLKLRGIGLRVLAGVGTGEIDTSTANGQLLFSFFAALAQFERDLLIERTRAGLVAARARGRVGGHPQEFSRAAMLAAQQMLLNPEDPKKPPTIKQICREFKVCRSTLYRYLRLDGTLTAHGVALRDGKKRMIEPKKSRQATS